MAAVAHRGLIPTSDGEQSPIWYKLTDDITPGTGMGGKPGRDEAGGLRRGSIDEEKRRFVRASSDPAGATPAAKGSGDLKNEMNPFEASFKNPSDKHARRARSQSPKSARATPMIGKLPPLAALASPSPTSGTGASGFGWNIDSLRSGPLSPSMLTAPTGSAGIFDPASMRTGLTPQIGVNSWGPDTPGTAAFFASLTNQTPDIAATLGSGAPGIMGRSAGQQRDGPNHFDAHFGRAMSQPNGVAALHASLGHQPFAQQGMPRPMTSQSFNIPTSQPGLAGAFGHNPLYLLSHGVSEHELAGVAEDDVMAAAALSNLQTTPIATYHPATTVPPSHISNGVHAEDNLPVPQPAGRGARGRNSTNGSANAAPSPAASSSGRKRKNDEVAKPARTSGRGKKAKSMAEDDDDLDDDDEAYMEDDIETKPAPAARGGRGNKKNETDEDKRKNFLERNRQAALKCRQRKKAWLQQLQAKVEYLTADNETLQSTANSLREEVAALRAVLAAHKDCPVQMPNGGPHTTVGAVLAQPPGQSGRY